MSAIRGTLYVIRERLHVFRERLTEIVTQLSCTNLSLILRHLGENIDGRGAWAITEKRQINSSSRARSTWAGSSAPARVTPAPGDARFERGCWDR